jgi:hypothetical protein
LLVLLLRELVVLLLLLLRTYFFLFDVIGFCLGDRQILLLLLSLLFDSLSSVSLFSLSSFPLSLSLSVYIDIYIYIYRYILYNARVYYVDVYTRFNFARNQL